MNLVAARRADQQGLAKLEMEVARLAEHVEEVDDHLRGVTGKESVDTRLIMMEKEEFEQKTILREFVKHVGSLEKDLDSIKIHRGIEEKSDAGKLDRFKAWLHFWGPVIIACLALVVPLAKMAVDKGYFARTIQYKPDDRLRKEIEADKKGTRGKAVKDKLEAIERTRKSLE